MMPSRDYTFRRATAGDLGLLAGWHAQPHVRKWWEAGDPYDDAELADPRVARWIVHHAGRPFAFMQDYAVHGWDDHHFAGLPAASRGIDQFIGDPAMVGQGHGTAFIGIRMQTLFAQGAPVIATDPHPDNARAIAVYARLGFKPSGPPCDTPWGRILPMLAQAAG